MNIEIKTLIKDELYKKIPSDVVVAIESEVNKLVYSKMASLEAENSEKFNKLVDDLYEKFDAQVNTVIVENVNAKIGDKINSKFYNIIKDMVNLLESSGIVTTEKTKEFQKKLQLADIEVEKAVKEREIIKDQLDDATKEAYILTKLKGMKPEIVDAALEYFKNKNIREIDDDEIQSFLDGDFSNILVDADMDIMSGDIDISQVEDALDEIKERKRTSPTPKFESLTKGLKQSKVMGGKGRNPDITTQTLQESAAPESTEVEDDTKDALSKIHDFMDLGYRFK